MRAMLLLTRGHIPTCRIECGLASVLYGDSEKGKKRENLLRSY